MTRRPALLDCTTYRIEPRGSRWVVIAERPSVTVPLRRFATQEEAEGYLAECEERARHLALLTSPNPKRYVSAAPVRPQPKELPHVP